MMACLCCCSPSFKEWLLPWSCQQWIWTSSAGLKNCLYDCGDQGAPSPPILPVYLVSLLQQKLVFAAQSNYLSQSCQCHRDFWVCRDSMVFYHCCSSLNERCLPSQHYTLTVPVTQCDYWSVFSSALCKSELGDIESSTVQQGTDITVIYSH